MTPYDIDLDRNPANFQPLTPLTFLERAAAVFSDHTEQPAAATSRGAEPPKSSMSSPAVHGDAPGWPRCRVSPLPPSMLRQTRSISGAMRRMIASVRQSKD